MFSRGHTQSSSRRDGFSSIMLQTIFAATFHITSILMLQDGIGHARFALPRHSGESDSHRSPIYAKGGWVG